MTLSEILLWQKIRKKSLGYEFHRQVPIGEYIVDFYCHELSLAIEIDGCSHFSSEQQSKDVDRQSVLEDSGVRVIRFDDMLVKRDMNEVIRQLQSFIRILEKGHLDG